MVHFIGAGPGAADLITVRGARLLGEADVIIYAGSLVNPALLEYKKPGCAVYDSAGMTLEEVISVMAGAEGKHVVRLHTGDPSLYGAIREQMDELDGRGIPYDVTPGVSSFSGAAAALEAGESGFVYTCPGWCAVDGRIFRCAGGIPHGEVDLAGALEKSCNGYFIRLGQALGADAVRAMAEQLGFGQAIPLTDALHTAAGVLPEREALASSGAYANFCFGQGELLASPLQVAAMMNTIACGGICRTPLLLETTLDETTGAPLTALSHVRSRRVLTKRTAAALQALLAGVVAGGTGHEAALPGQTAAGKTGTAQTGQFSGGTELKNYWFAGFVPAEQPRYTIVVLQDTQAEPAFSSAAIFARVAAGLEILAP